MKCDGESGLPPIVIIIAMALICTLGQTAAAQPWEWELLPSPDHDLNVARHGLTGEAVNGNLFAIGGVVMPGGPGDAQDVVSKYDPTYDPTGGPPWWSLVAPMPTARHSLESAVIGESIYAVGGHVANSRSETERYDVNGNTWYSHAPLNRARSGLGVAAYGGKLYAFGGNSYGTVQSSIEEYDPAADEWTLLSVDMPLAGHPGQAVTLGDRIYLAGGSYGSSVIGSVWSFDPVAYLWDTTLPDMNVARGNHGLVVAGNRIYAMGGSNTTGVLDSVESWAPGETSWQLEKPLNVARVELGAAVLPLQDGTYDIYVFGGHDGVGDFASTERLHIPEPATLSLLAFGGLAMMRRRRRRA